MSSTLSWFMLSEKHSAHAFVPRKLNEILFLFGVKNLKQWCQNVTLQGFKLLWNQSLTAKLSLLCLTSSMNPSWREFTVEKKLLSNSQDFSLNFNAGARLKNGGKVGARAPLLARNNDSSPSWFSKTLKVCKLDEQISSTCRVFGILFTGERS